MDQGAGENADAPIAEGRRLGDFTLLRRLGRGGQGEVYEARQESLGRLVALKVLPAHLSLDAERVRRFRREAAAGGRLAHPNIVAVHAVGEEQGVAYIAQELVPSGRTLADEIDDARRRPELPEDWVARVTAWCEGIARGLHAAHEAGVVHRDVKPSNVLVTADGAPMLADFGLALMHDDLLRSATGQAMGTPYYMSPEQASDRVGPVDRRSDVFSLGATLYEALTLHRPFEGETRERVVHAVLLHHPPDPHRLRGRVPRDVSVLCMKALEKRPDARYATAEDLADDLERLRTGQPILARPPTLFAQSGRWARRHPGRVAAAAGVLLLAAWVATLSHAIGLARAELGTSISAEMQARSDLAVARAAAAKRDDLLDMFTGVLHPTSADDSEQTLRDIAIRLRDLLPGIRDEPEIAYYVGLFAGINFLRVREYAEAGALLEDAHALARTLGDSTEATHEDKLAVGAFHLARHRLATGRRAEARTLLEQGLALLEEVGHGESEDAWAMLTHVAKVELDDGRLVEAEAYYRRYLAIGETLDPPRTAVAQATLADFLVSVGRAEEAAPLAEQAWRVMSGQPMSEDRLKIQRIAALHRDLRARRARQADRAAEAAEDTAAAQALFDELLAERRRRRPEGDAATAQALVSYGSFLNAQARHDEARTQLEHAVAMATGVLGARDELTLEARNNLAVAMLGTGDVDAAVETFRAIVDDTEERPASNMGQIALQNMAIRAYNAGDLVEARACAERLLVRTPPGHRALPARQDMLRKIEQRAATTTSRAPGD